MLMYHADSEIKCVLGGAYDDLFPVDEYLPLVREVDAGEHIHKRRFPAAVLAEQREDLSPVYVQPDLVVCHDLAERFCDVAHLNGGYLIVQEQCPPVSIRNSRFAISVQYRKGQHDTGE